MLKKIKGTFNKMEKDMGNFNTELEFNKNPPMEILGLKSTIS